MSKTIFDTFHTTAHKSNVLGLTTKLSSTANSEVYVHNL